MKEKEIVSWLKEDDPEKLEILWQEADQIRANAVGDEVHLRGLLEISNYCSRNCLYCGLRSERKNLERYRMSEKEIQECIKQLAGFGYGTVVLQAGEDPGITPESISELIQWIKEQTNLAVTLSFGEQSEETLRKWRYAGGDRYLLRIETTNQALLKKIHPGEPYGSRMDILQRIRDIGYEVGSGVMVGIPGQTYEMLAHDLLWFREMDLDMIGIGPYIPHPDTPLPMMELTAQSNQVPGTELMTNKTVALARILCPEANIPATTALATINIKNGREYALSHGANVVMPNVTPTKYRIFYEIYPNKSCIYETADVCHSCIKQRIIKLGRKIGVGPGGRKKRHTK